MNSLGILSASSFLGTYVKAYGNGPKTTAAATITCDETRLLEIVRLLDMQPSDDNTTTFYRLVTELQHNESACETLLAFRDQLETAHT